VYSMVHARHLADVENENCRPIAPLAKDARDAEKDNRAGQGDGKRATETGNGTGWKRRGGGLSNSLTTIISR